MDWVLDCSSLASLFLPDESSLKVRSFFADLPEDNSFWIPALWWYEMTNVLTVAERKKRLNHADVYKIISLFDQFNLNTDNALGTEFSHRIYELAKTYKLSAYDATYLELAIRKKAGMVTLDNQLINATKIAGITTFNL